MGIVKHYELSALYTLNVVNGVYTVRQISGTVM